MPTIINPLLSRAIKTSTVQTLEQSPIALLAYKHNNNNRRMPSHLQKPLFVDTRIKTTHGVPELKQGDFDKKVDPSTPLPRITNDSSIDLLG